MSVNIKHMLESCINNGSRALEYMRDREYAPNNFKVFEKKYNRVQAAQMVGVSPNGLKHAETTGKLISPEVDPRTNRPLYSISNINRARDHFKTRPGRKKNDETVVMGIINFKGGVYKSTITTHYAQYMALKGYKVLLIDGDSQASATRFFFFNPDDEEEDLKTIGDYITGEVEDLRETVLETHIEGLDIIPANLSLYNVELQIPFEAGQNHGDKTFFEKLRPGIDQVKDYYDIVIIDSPPSLGIISMSIVYSCNSLIIPVPPAYSDYCSTLQFFYMLNDVVDSLGERHYKFIKLLLTKFDTSEESKEFVSLIKGVFGDDILLKSAFSNTKEVLKASSSLKTVFETTDISVKSTYDRAIKIINNFCAEIEENVLKTWPSYAKEMLEEGVII